MDSLRLVIDVLSNRGQPTAIGRVFLAIAVLILVVGFIGLTAMFLAIAP